MEQTPKLTKKTDITAGFIRDVAIMASAGTPKSVIIKKLNTTPFIINEVLAMEDCKAVIAEINTSTLEEAKLKIRKGVSGLADDAVRVIAENLKKNNLEAAKMVLRSLGLEKGEENQAGNAFTLVLANQPEQPKTVEVEREV